MHHGFKKIYKLRQLLFSWDEECLPGKIKVNLRGKIKDANKCDETSSKHVRKSPHTAQKAILK